MHIFNINVAFYTGCLVRTWLW